MSMAPVNVATPPFTSTIPTSRTARLSSAARSAARASGADLPARMSASPSGPYDGSTNDCVATAPTPASAQGTTAPTENQWLCTATPMSPVAGSRATIEYVATGRGRKARSFAGRKVTRAIESGTSSMAEPPAGEDSLPETLRLLAIVGATRAAALFALVTVFWIEPWVSHLVQDMRTWHAFFLSAQAGLVPYVHFTKEYPVLGGAL